MTEDTTEHGRKQEWFIWQHIPFASCARRKDGTERRPWLTTLFPTVEMSASSGIGTTGKRCVSVTTI